MTWHQPTAQGSARFREPFWFASRHDSVRRGAALDKVAELPGRGSEGGGAGLGGGAVLQWRWRGGDDPRLAWPRGLLKGGIERKHGKTGIQ